MFISFFTSFQVLFPTQFPMNYSCNIIVPSLVLLLCQLFTFAHNMRYCFTFLVTHSTKWWLGCFIYIVFHIVCSNCLFLRDAQYSFSFNFQVSFSQPVPCFFSSVVSGISLTSCPTHSFVFPQFFLFPYPTLCEFCLINCIGVFCCFCSFHTFN